MGVLIAGIPLLWFSSWLTNQGEAEVSVEAKAAIRLTELIIDQAVTNFDQLDSGGIRSCRPSDVQLLQRISFASDSIRELAVVDRTGQTLCTDRGNVFPLRVVIATATTSNPDLMLDVVRTAKSDERLLRVRRLPSLGRAGLSALLSVNQLLPRIAPDGRPFSGYAQMTLADRTLVKSSSNNFLAITQHADPLLASATSKRYGLIMTVAMERHGVIATLDDLRRIGIVSITFTTAAILIIAFIFFHWKSTPISIIQNALVSDEFTPYYQPIIDINSGKLLGAEILVRWRKSDGTIVEPEAFIALLEAHDLVRDFTRVLMRKVCTALGPTLGERPEMYIAFNVAPRHFSDPAIINDVGSIFGASPIAFSQIVFELTERCEFEDRDAAHRIIAALHGLGIRIALDDFGTGRNGLLYVQKLGIDIIKIDKTFVDTITTAHRSQVIAATVAGLARELKLQVVAEGVESFDQVTYLRQHGIEAAQGYLFAPPLPDSAFLDLIKAFDPRPLEIGGQSPQSANRAA